MQELSTKRRETFLSFQPPAIGDEEIEAVAETLRSGWLTTGPRTAELERRFAEYVEAKHALAVTSGTAALHLALVALAVGPGDEVITTPITWPATANVIVHTGATPVFADVRESDLNIDPDEVARLFTAKTKAILPVHLAGQPADLDPLRELGVPIVEDAAHAVESGYRGGKIGGLSAATCFSLYATKNVAAGEGGVITTDDDAVAHAVDEHRIMRRGHGSLYDIAVPGYKANLSDVLASMPSASSTSSSGTGRSGFATSPPTTRPWPTWKASNLWRAIPGTRMPSTCTSSASMPSGPARPATSTSARSPTSRSGPASTSSPSTG